ncbi:hypothetical protein HYH03_016499 [Edaphochlamys debaryana]|uniref:Rubredoxin-like domain-containing protein n=1 Tax=Edaphochlamys debaryana TaxID=47281 RepID=A0A836BQ91_9CHLO|nr:hypothetical protein HYH03_016499 [Edaphochlamys debaryana]|eukprot:KAG2484752.1 hypothetical protein HYH03_016499 [Edaphochlamys debaryana]
MAAMLAQRQTAVSGVRVAAKAPVLSAARSRVAVKPQALFGFGAAKPAAGGKPAAMICIDCGYIYDGKDFSKEPASYKCPACGVGKNRFKVYKGTDGKGNSAAAMKKRKEAKQW